MPRKCAVVVSGFVATDIVLDEPPAQHELDVDAPKRRLERDSIPLVVVVDVAVAVVVVELEPEQTCFFFDEEAGDDDRAELECE